jgi:hypothetical protein
MNRAEVSQLLAAAGAVDPKAPQPGELVLRIWTTMLADIPMAAAERAVVDWYRSNRETIQPADIVNWYRDRRRYEAEQRELPPVNPAAITAGVDRAVAALAAKKAIKAGEDPGTALEIAEGEAGARRAVRSVPCPHCLARPGQPCTGPRGTPLTKAEAHDSRIQAAMGQQVDVAPRNPAAVEGEIAGLRPADPPDCAG